MKAMQLAKVLSGHVPPHHSKGSLKELSPTCPSSNCLHARKELQGSLTRSVGHNSLSLSWKVQVKYVLTFKRLGTF